MALGFLKHIRGALANLNPDDVRELANRPLNVWTLAGSPESYAALESFLAPPHVNERRRWVAEQSLRRGETSSSNGGLELLFIEEGLPVPAGWIPGQTAFRFSRVEPEQLVKEVLVRQEDWMLPLARRFEPFRAAASHNAIQSVARENALFSLMTAIPNLVPSLVEVPWAIGEFASDTAVITVNQIRLAFLLAAAADREVGYRQQKTEIGSIIAGAWGWRALAREMAGKIPFGGGLIPKAAIAYAGTYVAGLSLERVYRTGYGLDRKERKLAYKDAFERGRHIAGAILETLRRNKK
jgi:hypothetical protein